MALRDTTLVNLGKNRRGRNREGAWRERLRRWKCSIKQHKQSLNLVIDWEKISARCVSDYKVLEYRIKKFTYIRKLHPVFENCPKLRISNSQNGQKNRNIFNLIILIYISQIISEVKYLFIFFFLLHLQHLGQCLAHGSHSIYTPWMIKYSILVNMGNTSGLLLKWSKNWCNYITE